MSSHYSPGDVSADVETLVRRLLKQYPTLMFTSSAVAQDLPAYQEADVRRALFLEAERGLLEPFISWRCEECDSPSLYHISEKSPFGSCPSCGEERKFEQFLYFRATDALMRHLDDDRNGDDPKKADAANEGRYENIVSTSSSPQKSDIATSRDRELMQRLVLSSERSAVANEQSAASTTTMAKDPTARRSYALAVVAIIVTVLVTVLIWWAQESHFYARLTKTGEFAPTAAHNRSVARARPHGTSSSATHSRRPQRPQSCLRH
jgi:hypothetical protein